jgi:hypothetical protein
MRGTPAGISALLLLFTTGEILASVAFAQEIHSSYYDPSVRSQGMGGSGVALVSDDPFSSYLNPANLSNRSGISWGHSNTDATPGTSEHARLRSDYFTIGGYGIGLSLDGRPFTGVGGTKMDYGVLNEIGRLPSGAYGVIDSSSNSEQVAEVGLGINVFQGLRHIAELFQSDSPKIEDRIELSIGMRWKRYRSNEFTPAGPTSSPLFPPDSSTGAARDWGVLVRARIHDGLTARADAGKDRRSWLSAIVIDLTAGFSDVNSAADTMISARYPAGWGTLPREILRRGLGLQATSGLPGFLGANDGQHTVALSRWLGPTLAFSVTLEDVRDRAHVMCTSDGRACVITGPLETKTSAVGAEAILLGVVSIRAGHRSDDDTQQSGTTWGIGTRLHYSNVFSVRWDWASYPSIGTHTATRHPWGLQLSVDPLGSRDS